MGILNKSAWATGVALAVLGLPLKASATGDWIVFWAQSQRMPSDPRTEDPKAGPFRGTDRGFIDFSWKGQRASRENAHFSVRPLPPYELGDGRFPAAGMELRMYEPLTKNESRVTIKAVCSCDQCPKETLRNIKAIKRALADMVEDGGFATRARAIAGLGFTFNYEGAMADSVKRVFLDPTTGYRVYESSYQLSDPEISIDRVPWARLKIIPMPYTIHDGIPLDLIDRQR